MRMRSEKSKGADEKPEEKGAPRPSMLCHPDRSEAKWRDCGSARSIARRGTADPSTTA